MDEFTLWETFKITPTQLESLVSFMEKNPEFAVDKDYLMLKTRRALWFKLQFEMNSVKDGVQKGVAEWKRTWKDLMARAHTKTLYLINNEEEGNTQNPYEERILKIISVNSHVKSPEPSTDVSVVPDTGVVSTSPVVNPDGVQLSATPVEQEKNIEEDNTQSIDESLPDITQKTETLTELQVTQQGNNFPESTSKAVSQGSAETSKTSNDCIPEPANPISADNYETTNHPSSKFRCKALTSITGRKRKLGKVIRDRNVLSAEKAVGIFGNITETNSAVLKKVATSMELQAAGSAKQTQIMQELLSIAKKK